MTSSIALNSSRPNNTGARPSVTSFDSGYEHNFDHYVDVRLLVLDAEREEREENDVSATVAAAS
jgi:hypothetical protein